MRDLEDDYNDMRGIASELLDYGTALIKMVEQLAEQQAMTSDWYVAELEVIKKALTRIDTLHYL